MPRQSINCSNQQAVYGLPHHCNWGRFPISGFRIPNSVWGMGVSEYRTMRSRVRGAHMDGRARGVTGWDMGCLTSEFYVNRGLDIRCPGGVPGGLVWNREGGQVTSDKEGRNPHTRGAIDWPTGRTSGQAGNCPRKEGRRAADYRGIGANKRPLGASKGLGRGLGLSTAAR